MNVIFRGLNGQKPPVSTASAILQAAIRAADPAGAVTAGLIDLEKQGAFSYFQRVGLVAMGKAAVPMAQSSAGFFGRRLSGGVVVTKKIPADGFFGLEDLRVLEGAHPVPDERSMLAGQAILDFIETNKSVDALIFLISGGASALVTQPADSLSLADIQKTTSLLLACGASIDEINTIRKHLDVIKGGGLAAKAAPVPCITLVLSDVPGDRLDMIASGPTVPDQTTFVDAMAVLEKYSLGLRIPRAVADRLSAGVRGSIHETPKPEDALFTNHRVMIVGSLERSIGAAIAEASRQGYQTERLTPVLHGEAAEQGKKLGRMLAYEARRKPTDRRMCWIGGGETTVTMGSAPAGKGGRNTELALAAVDELDGVKNAALITFATDGDDGMSPAAGAVVTGETASQAKAYGLRIDEYLSTHDSYTFFHELGAAIETGPTGTNVNDLVILLLN